MTLRAARKPDDTDALIHEVELLQKQNAELVHRISNLQCTVEDLTKENEGLRSSSASAHLLLCRIFDELSAVQTLAVKRRSKGKPADTSPRFPYADGVAETIPCARVPEPVDEFSALQCPHTGQRDPEREACRDSKLNSLSCLTRQDANGQAQIVIPSRDTYPGNIAVSQNLTQSSCVSRCNVRNEETDVQLLVIRKQNDEKEAQKQLRAIPNYDGPENEKDSRGSACISLKANSTPQAEDKDQKQGEIGSVSSGDQANDGKNETQAPQWTFCSPSFGPGWVTFPNIRDDENGDPSTRSRWSPHSTNATTSPITAAIKGVWPTSLKGGGAWKPSSALIGATSAGSATPFSEQGPRARTTSPVMTKRARTLTPLKKADTWIDKAARELTLPLRMPGSSFSPFFTSRLSNLSQSTPILPSTSLSSLPWLPCTPAFASFTSSPKHAKAFLAPSLFNNPTHTIASPVQSLSSTPTLSPPSALGCSQRRVPLIRRPFSDTASVHCGTPRGASPALKVTPSYVRPGVPWSPPMLPCYPLRNPSPGTASAPHCTPPVVLSAPTHTLSNVQSDLQWSPSFGAPSTSAGTPPNVFPDSKDAPPSARHALSSSRGKPPRRPSAPAYKPLPRPNFCFSPTLAPSTLPLRFSPLGGPWQCALTDHGTDLQSTSPLPDRNATDDSKSPFSRQKSAREVLGRAIETPHDESRMQKPHEAAVCQSERSVFSFRDMSTR